MSREAFIQRLLILVFALFFLFFVLLEEGTKLRKFVYLCGNSHSECGCKMLVNLMAYLSSDGCSWSVVD
jgi:hypothetical protein